MTAVNPTPHIRIDPEVTTDDDRVADPIDGQDLHEWPDESGLTAPDEPLTVAIMDSGIHPDLVEEHPWFEHTTVSKRYDATGNGVGDEVGHGSACAGIYGRNAASVIADAFGGDGPLIEFYDVRIFGGEGRTGLSTIIDAYKWLIDHADEIDVVNMSWGASNRVAVIEEYHERLVDQVHDVGAAGNTGDDGGSPATAPNAFSAGAVDQHGKLTRFSSSNPKRDNPDVMGLGKNVKLARAPGTSMGRVIDNQFVKASGTSFSAPYLGAGYCLALWADRVSWDARFEEVAPDIADTRRDGDGLFVLAPALSGEDPETPTPSSTASVWNFLGKDTIWLGADWFANGRFEVTKQAETDEHTDLRFKRKT